MNTNQTKPATHNADLEHLPAALLPLTQQRRWVTWCWEFRANKRNAGKWTKPPRQALAPERNAKSDDPATWGNYSDAVNTVANGRADGIGFMLLGADIGAGDLDHCRDPESGKIESWAEKICDEAGDAYKEITVSASGLRLIGTVKGPAVHRRFPFDRNGAGLELYRGAPRYITISGAELGTCESLPSIDGLIDTLLARFSVDAGNMDFNSAGPQSMRALDYDHLIEHGAPEGERSELFQAVVWHLAGKGWTADQITDELARQPNGIGAKYADRLHAEVTRSCDKWRSRKRQTATGEAPSTNDPWPQIYVVDGESPRVTNEAENALLSAGYELYRRGGLMVRPVLSDLAAADDRETSAWRLIPVTQSYLIDKMTCAAQFLRWDARAQRFVPTDCPEKVAKTYLLGREGDRKLPILTAITNAPFLRKDGSICERPGYDSTSGVLFKSDQVFPPMPQTPSKSEAADALVYIDRIISSFPFVTPADHSVALAAILTAVDRRSMATAPLFALTAPTAGTGKSLLIDLVAMIAIGRLMPVIAQSRTEEELEKRLGAALLAGDAMISIDNCDRPLQGSFLCQALTQQYLAIRILGLSQQPETPINAVFFANGNNLTIAGDLTRRTLLCSLDAGCERPELRHFDVDVIAVARANRARLVTAALTVLRAWHLSKERVDLAPFGSFSDWSHRNRAPLVWLGCPDPCDTMTKVREGDPYSSEFRAVIAQWRVNLGTNDAYTVQEIVGRALNVADFQVALATVAGSRNGHLVSNRRLGRWLKRVEGQVCDGIALRKVGVKDGYPRWQLMVK